MWIWSLGVSWGRLFRHGSAQKFDVSGFGVQEAPRTPKNTQKCLKLCPGPKPGPFCCGPRPCCFGPGLSPFVSSPGFCFEPWPAVAFPLAFLRRCLSQHCRNMFGNFPFVWSATGPGPKRGPFRFGPQLLCLPFWKKRGAAVFAARRFRLDPPPSANGREHGVL